MIKNSCQNTVTTVVSVVIEDLNEIIFSRNILLSCVTSAIKFFLFLILLIRFYYFSIPLYFISYFPFCHLLYAHSSHEIDRDDVNRFATCSLRNLRDFANHLGIRDYATDYNSVVIINGFRYMTLDEFYLNLRSPFHLV